MSDRETPDAGERDRVDAQENVAWGVSDATGVKSSDLKARFHEGSIPLALDFANLIDMAECGRRAVGGSADQANRTAGLGLSLAGEADVANKGKLSVKAGDGITVDERGVNIDPERVLPQGMIVMFSGKTVPRGWALCDGANRTPDLRNRFILAGALEEVGAQSADSVDGRKTYTAETDTKCPSIKVKVDDTKLELKHVPPHEHKITNNNGKHISKAYIDTRRIQGKDVEILHSSDYSDSVFKAQSSGEGQAYVHTAAATQDEHFHKTTITTPYYILAFIMKT